MAFRIPFGLAIVLVAGAVYGQRTITLHHAEVAGSVVQIVPPNIAVKSATGQQWILKIDRGTRIKVTGTADPAMLTAGTCVRFTADIDKKTGRAKDKIDRITIFTETAGVAERTLGVERAGQRHASEEQPGGPMGPPRRPRPGPQGGPGDQPPPPPDLAGDPGIPDDGPANNKSTKRRGSASKAPDKSVPDVASYDICAQVVSCHAGRLIVNVQNRFFKPKITAELAPDATIDLDLGNLTAIKPGDNVTAAEGYYLNPGVCEKTLSIEVALANPLGPAGARGRHPKAVAKAADAGKTKSNADKTAAKKPAETGTTKKAPAKGNGDLEAPDLPSDPPAESKPNSTQHEPAIPDDNVMPPPDDDKPPKKM
jgi:hypothetical protein